MVGLGYTFLMNKTVRKSELWALLFAVGIVLALSFLFAQKTSAATPFGGAIEALVYCNDGSRWVHLGGPRGGDFIWTAGTRTYEFGPPKRVGQWLLGLSGGAGSCTIGAEPFTTSIPGQVMYMVGSSR